MNKTDCASEECHAISQAAAETAAGIVVERHNLAAYEGEPALEALCWAMGEGIDYGQAMREFGHALLEEQKDPGTERLDAGAN